MSTIRGVSFKKIVYIFFIEMLVYNIMFQVYNLVIHNLNRLHCIYKVLAVLHSISL